jgi:uncharacterized protein (TIGR03663 family)
MGGRTEEDERGSASSTTESMTTEDRSVLDRYEQLTLFRVVGAITLLAVVLRLVVLGARTAHWDEARVAYWAYFYSDTGSTAYYYEEHGPLVQIVAARLFDVFGVNDFAARLPVAVVGGILPSAALLYRKHLQRAETIALAILLALNPVLLYYSRFMRSDVLVAVFMFTALGLLVRYYDTRKVQYLLVSGVVFGLGFGSKENAVIYLVTWIGAVGLLADQFLHSPASEESGLDRVRENLHTYRSRVKAAVYRLDYAIGAVLTFVVTLVVLFAPRGHGLDRRLYTDSDADPVTLGDAVSNPAEIPALVDESLGEAYSGYIDWFAQSQETTLDTYLSFLWDYVTLLVEYAPLMTSLAIVGIIIERYASDRSRTLVMFMAYCGVASLVGYPLGSHIQGDSGWLSVHVVVPLLVPAAVGLAWAYHSGRDLVSEKDLNPAVLLVILVLVFGLWAWFIPVQSVYMDDTAEDNKLVQYAQPASDLGPLVETMDDIATENEGTDLVLYYGEQNDSYDNAEALVQQRLADEYPGQWQIRPPCSVWGNSQPLNWYFAVSGADADCERSQEGLTDAVEDGEIPMIITVPSDSTVPESALGDSYIKQSYYLRNIGEEVVVYTHNSWASESN